MSDVGIVFPRIFRRLFEPMRYKIFYGGRGGAKSWAFARALLILAVRKRLRILCAREYQVSIVHSVHKLLSDQIVSLKLDALYHVTKTSVTGSNGSEFIFKGLRHNAQEIKSLEGVDICWVEEAQAVSADSWDLLIPTIRKGGSEIWISFNPCMRDDATYRRFVVTPPDNAIVVKTSWRDNPWFPATLFDEMEHCRRTDAELYSHIWEGEPRTVSDAQVFKGRYSIENFDTPADARFYHGVDWGFARDATALVRCYIKDDCLYIDKEAYGAGVELDDLAEFFESVPTSRMWCIRADGARPETISHMRRRGFDIRAAKKWSGSIADGLSVLKGFQMIYVHPDCAHTAEEFKMYSYKTDRITNEVLPILADADNHCIDALRYALDGYIRGRA